MLPNQLLGLFRTNIIFVDPLGLTGSSTGATDYVKITAQPDIEGCVGSWNGPSCGVMKLSQAQSGDEEGAFPTWICDYSQNQIKYKTLSSDRPFFFTAEMNGCTLGIGSPSDGGVVTVSHANAYKAAYGSADLKKPPQRIAAMANAQKSMTSGGMPGASLFQPFDYNLSGQVSNPGSDRQSTLNTTTFGVLDGNNWTFWFQQHLRTAGGRAVPRRCMLKTFKKLDLNSLACA